MRKLILILLTCLLFGCKSTATLQNDNILHRIFSPEEIGQLTTLLRRYDALLIDSMGVKDTAEAYLEYARRQVAVEPSGEVIFFLEAKHLRSLQLLLDSVTFSAVWDFGLTVYAPNDDSVSSLRYAQPGKFVQLLEAYGKVDSGVYEYYDSFSQAGGISPSIFVLTTHFIEKFDVKDPTIRLILAIHHITHHDNYLMRRPYQTP